jgi:hypothetical protein
MASFVCRRKEQIKHKRNHKNKFWGTSIKN